uniref:Uncharacterized protein n=1 Tax=Kalanchoe fedtschenkoi TaxID=63787 RepID=A0A7N0VEU5_KALFE
MKSKHYKKKVNLIKTNTKFQEKKTEHTNGWRHDKDEASAGVEQRSELSISFKKLDFKISMLNESDMLLIAFIICSVSDPQRLRKRQKQNKQLEGDYRCVREGRYVA